MEKISLSGSLAIPDGAQGLVLVVVGAPGHRRDPLRLCVADVLHQAGLATLVASLVTGDEAAPGIERLAGRVASAIAWSASEPRLRGLPVGVFADGTAVAPALVALAHDVDRVLAFVGCGGRPDAARLPEVRAPALLLVGAEDEGGLAAARAAVRALPSHAQLAVVEETVDPLQDADAIGTVAWLARRWFLEHLAAPVS